MRKFTAGSGLTSGSKASVWHSTSPTRRTGNMPPRPVDTAGGGVGGGVAATGVESRAGGGGEAAARRGGAAELRRVAGGVGVVLDMDGVRTAKSMPSLNNGRQQSPRRWRWGWGVLKSCVGVCP